MRKSPIARHLFTLTTLGLSLLAAGCSPSSSSSSQATNTSANGSALYKELTVPSGSTQACPIGRTQLSCRDQRTTDSTNDIKISLRKTKAKGQLFQFGDAKYVANGQIQGLKNPNGDRKN